MEKEKDQKEDLKEFARHARKMLRRFPGMKIMRCANCGKGGGTLEKAGKDNEGRTRYVHKDCDWESKRKDS